MSNNAKRQIEKLNRLYKQQDELYHSFAVRFGISDTAFWVLYAICSSDAPCTQYDLCNAWYFPKQTVNSAIAGLEKTGYLVLKPLPGTRNRKNAELTQAGKQFCERTIIPLLEAEKRTFLLFSEEEQNIFMAFMEKQIDYLIEETEGIRTQ